jgi:hypothetical protein
MVECYTTDITVISSNLIHVFNLSYLIIINNKIFEPYAMKVARTVLRGGSISNKTTYLIRPYAALLLLVIKYDRHKF